MLKQVFFSWLFVPCSFFLCFLAGFWGKYATDGLGIFYTDFWGMLAAIAIYVVARRYRQERDIAYAQAFPIRFWFYLFSFFVMCILSYFSGIAIISWFMGYSSWILELMRL